MDIVEEVHENDMNSKKKIAALKFIFFSIIGVLAYFAPVVYQGSLTIPIDVAASWFLETLPTIAPVYAMLMFLSGTIYPFITKTWNKSKFEIIFSVFRVLGLVAALLIYFEIGPAWMMREDMGIFLMDMLVYVSLIVPIGAIFLALLTQYGLLEFMGALFQKIMRPMWKTPGRSALIAVTSRASFFPTYLLANKEFKEGKYTVKEATIIVTGFISIDVTFMIIVARTLDMMELFHLFFIVSIIVIFLVTAITARIWPINRLSKEYYNRKGFPEEIVKEQYFKTAWNTAIEIAGKSPPLGRSILAYLKDGILMIMSVLSMVLSIGLIGLYVADYTSLFDYIAYIFYPIVWILQIPDTMLLTKAVSIGIMEIMLPPLLVVGADIIIRFIVAVVSVSSILFFSTTIPCILATDIPVRLTDLIFIWFERVVLSLIIITPIAFLLL